MEAIEEIIQTAPVEIPRTNGRDTIHIDLPACTRYLNILDACITELLEQVDTMPDPGVTINDIRVAAQEACMNIIDHAYTMEATGRIGITLILDQTSQHLIMELRDTGYSFDFDISNFSVKNMETVNEDEVGLFLLYMLMDEVIYVPQRGNNFWRLRKHLS
jgi:anti-sigma regulatory factor (Ser/Thr protein kinase)